MNILRFLIDNPEIRPKEVINLTSWVPTYQWITIANSKQYYTAISGPITMIKYRITPSDRLIEKLLL